MAEAPPLTLNPSYEMVSTGFYSLALLLESVPLCHSLCLHRGHQPFLADKEISSPN